MNSQWIRRFQNNSRIQTRLFCFHHAGGSASFFKTWHKGLPDSVEVCAIQLPGRWERVREPCFRRLDPLIDAMFDPMKNFMDRPFVLFGHSLGALIAYEFAKKLLACGHSPTRLVCSARRAPHVAAALPFTHQLSDKELLERLRTRSSSDPDGGQSLNIQNALLPVVRADFEIGESYTCSPSDPLPIPIDVFGGNQDTQVDQHGLTEWQAYTSTGFSLSMFDGKHFYLRTQEQQVLARLCEILEEKGVQAMAVEKHR